MPLPGAKRQLDLDAVRLRSQAHAAPLHAYAPDDPRAHAAVQKVQARKLGIKVSPTPGRESRLPEGISLASPCPCKHAQQRNEPSGGAMGACLTVAAKMANLLTPPRPTWQALVRGRMVRRAMRKAAAVGLVGSPVRRGNRLPHAPV